MRLWQSAVSVRKDLTLWSQLSNSFCHFYMIIYSNFEFFPKFLECGYCSLRSTESNLVIWAPPHVSWERYDYIPLYLYLSKCIWCSGTSGPITMEKIIRGEKMDINRNESTTLPCQTKQTYRCWRPVETAENFTSDRLFIELSRFSYSCITSLISVVRYVTSC